MPRRKHTHVAILLNTNYVEYVPYDKNHLKSMMEIDKYLEVYIREFMPRPTAKSLFLELHSGYLMGGESDYFGSVPIKDFAKRIGPISGRIRLERVSK